MSGRAAARLAAALLLLSWESESGEGNEDHNGKISAPSFAHTFLFYKYMFLNIVQRQVRILYLYNSCGSLVISQFSFQTFKMFYQAEGGGKLSSLLQRLHEAAQELHLQTVAACFEGDLALSSPSARRFGAHADFPTFVVNLDRSPHRRCSLRGLGTSVVETPQRPQ